MGCLRGCGDGDSGLIVLFCATLEATSWLLSESSFFPLAVLLIDNRASVKALRSGVLGDILFGLDEPFSFLSLLARVLEAFGI